MSTNPISTSSDTESVISCAKERTIFDEEELYNTLTDVYLPEVKQLPVQTLGTNLAYASSCNSLSISTGYYSAKNKLDDDGLDFEQEDSRPCSPDTLHTPERPYQRQGPCRYIFEEDPSFVASSKRGWMNFIALFAIITILLGAFVVWPVWWDVIHRRHRDSLGQYDLARQSGPFLSSELPGNSLT
ncbi:hypothetical protein PGT21_027272 [Puccinia graminis f. sp. tritici]|nr:hypothetical protein PGTUg99_014361 [Puccinia graminis f. sp. tritici]KAA1117914.1 hypothetical protein PGT21_027272 [Puccinia graminis f. sp. tritici]